LFCLRQRTGADQEQRESGRNVRMRVCLILAFIVGATHFFWEGHDAFLAHRASRGIELNAATKVEDNASPLANEEATFEVLQKARARPGTNNQQISGSKPTLAG